MYIPVSYFGGGEGCITATGGVTGSYVSGGVLWKYHKFDADNFESSSFNVISGSTLRGKLLVIGGGGSGGAGAGVLNSAAGGGGGGGVVYYEQFPIITGTYNLVVAKGVPGVYAFDVLGTEIANAGNTGRYSSVQTPFGPYTPFTSSLIIAFGGGGGGVAGDGVTASFGLIPGAGGASGGGNAQNVNGYAIASSSNFAGDGFGGINLNDQGNFGGSIPADSVGFNTQFMVTGGGGAGAASLSVLDTGGSGGSPQFTDGGDGLQFDMDGTASYYAGGGGSFSCVKATNSGYTNSGLGAGNWGGGSRGIGDTNGFSDSGSGGLIIFSYRLCPFANDCRTYTAYASSSGATIYFVDCYTNLPTSKSVAANQSSTICSRPFVQYPYITGTGASLVQSGSCTINTTYYKSYVLTECGTSSSSYVNISDSASLSVGQVIKPFNYTGDCYTISNIGAYSQSYQIVYTSESFFDCNDCNDLYYAYNITRCNTTSSYSVKSLDSASIGTVFTTTNPDYPYCYSISSTISVANYPTIDINNTYPDCNTCTGSAGPFAKLLYSANSVQSYPGSGSKWYTIGLDASTAANTLTGSFSYNGCSINLNTNTGSVEYSGSGYTNPSDFTYLLCISASAGYFKNLIDGNSSIIFNDSDNSVFFESGSGPLYTTTGTTPANQLANSFTSSFNTLAFTRDSSNNMILRTSLDNFSGSYELSGSASQKAGFSTGFNVTKLLAYKGFNIKSIKLYDSVLTPSQMVTQSNCANC